MRENKRVKVKIGMKVKLKGNREELTDGTTEVKMRFQNKSGSQNKKQMFRCH